jgi:hypothetical protein
MYLATNIGNFKSQPVTEKQLSYSVRTQARGSLYSVISCSDNNTMVTEQQNERG